MDENAAPEIASRDEVLEMLTEKAREGFTGAMIALERALRAAERKEREQLDNELIASSPSEAGGFEGGRHFPHAVTRRAAQAALSFRLTASAPRVVPT